MRHNYLVMWHPVLKWGSPIPTLQPSKNFVAKATGVTQQTIRKNGWVWCKVAIDTPDEVTPADEVVRLDKMILELEEERDAWAAQVEAEGVPVISQQIPTR